MDAETRFNYLAGALAIFCPTISVLWLTRKLRPSVIIKELDELLRDTVCLYDSYVSDGLLDDDSVRESLKSELALEKLQRREERDAATFSPGSQDAPSKTEESPSNLIAHDAQAMEQEPSGSLEPDMLVAHGPEYLVSHADRFFPDPVLVTNPPSVTVSPSNGAETDAMSTTSTVVGDLSSRSRSFWIALTSWSKAIPRGKVMTDDLEQGPLTPVEAAS
ncbi:hypothetical protein DXG03_003419 [Asterophora parasitica]|uniref:Uncharacterized protein n=1 Tax=Asterophora parasitica TaxID=117018 RepID=A0A9P7G239_9AGAR|nr:hypothetical protein DXG03_003419 [Asterophora parasitica]